MFSPLNPPGHFEVFCNLACSLRLFFFFFNFLKKGTTVGLYYKTTGVAAVDVITDVVHHHLKSSASIKDALSMLYVFIIFVCVCLKGTAAMNCRL